MKWSIHQLQRYRQGAMSLDETVDLESIKQRNPEIREITPVHVTGSCTIGAKTITCHFRLEGTMTLPCARTWEDVAFHFSVESDEEFSWDEAIYSIDDEIHPVVGEVVDPTPVFEELLLLEIPLQVFSKHADKMTHAKGKGWSYSTDEEYNAKLRKDMETKVDPRLAVLAKLFESQDK